MTPRPMLDEIARDGFNAVLALEKHVRSSVESRLLELVKLRASMVNGCSYCIDMHGSDALSAGEDPRRLLAIAAWEESPFFTDQERAALALTDAVTRLDGGVDDVVWNRAIAAFGESMTGELVVAIATINVWNRIAISSRTPPPALGA